MKKAIKIALMILIVASMLVVLTGCGEEKEKPVVDVEYSLLEEKYRKQRNIGIEISESEKDKEISKMEKEIEIEISKLQKKLNEEKEKKKREKSLELLVLEVNNALDLLEETISVEMSEKIGKLTEDYITTSTYDLRKKINNKKQQIEEIGACLNSENLDEIKSKIENLKLEKQRLENIIT